jgi:endoglucanase
MAMQATIVTFAHYPNNRVGEKVPRPPGRAMKRHLFFPILLLALTGQAFPQSWIRVNQLGYLPQSIKCAVLVCRDAGVDPRGFALHDALTGDTLWSSVTVVPYGPFGAFARTYRLDFSLYRRVGAFFVSCDGVRSPSFRVAPDVYAGMADFLLRYMRQQRCGYNPFLRDSCHTHDGYVIYRPNLDSTMIDVVGGWHDASDYLQYVTTSANAVVQMMFAYEQNPAVFGDDVGRDGLPGSNGVPDILDEALWGVRWLRKMNPEEGMMFNQIADDRDHRGFRLPTEDTVNYGLGRARPVYFCTGSPQGLFRYKNRTTGLASTAGKFASAFAMAARLLRTSDPLLSDTLRQKAKEAYRAALEQPGVCQTAPCLSPYFYEEDNWVDDMELAAAQLALLYPDSAFARDAAVFGSREPVTPWMGADTARHYQWYPFVNLGHYYLAAGGESSQMFLDYMNGGLGRILDRGKGNAFLNGIPFIWCSNNLVAAALTQARLYAGLSGDSTYAPMEAALRDWLFGCNPWGTSMIVGVPRTGISPRDPHSAFTHVYRYPIDGGLVDGPVYGSIFKSLRGITLYSPDAFAAFQSDVAVYHDDWGDYSTNEPTMDGTASLTYYFSALESAGNPSSPLRGASWQHGAIIRLDSSRRVIYPVFTGHEFADGGEAILRALRKNRAGASFFFTGDFYRNSSFAGLIDSLRSDGHYLGAHSDRHLLYASWSNRDSLLVAREEFSRDIRANYETMKACGIDAEEARYFLPPYEWYNRVIAEWCADLGLQIVNFTPGTLSNADYTYPGPGMRYVSSDDILRSVLAAEASRPAGLGGFLLLFHVGVDFRRPDKFSERLDWLFSELRRRGYELRRL